MFFDRADVPRPSPLASEKAKRLLERALGPSKVLTGRDACEAYANDESEATGVVPDAVVPVPVVPVPVVPVVPLVPVELLLPLLILASVSMY